MESKEKNTKEKILEEALKLFAQSGYMGTSMNDIASKLGVTKAALYKHYKSKQEILDSIIEKMKESSHIYESFDSHYEIKKIYKNDSLNIIFYEFSIGQRKYRIFVELLGNNSMIFSNEITRSFSTTETCSAKFLN